MPTLKALREQAGVLKAAWLSRVSTLANEPTDENQRLCYAAHEAYTDANRKYLEARHQAGKKLGEPDDE